MALQYISDNSGNHTAVIIPIDEWNDIVATHEDLKELTEEKARKINDVARFKGLLNDEEAKKYHEYLRQARSEWDRDI